jgi:hypothetical protein
VGIRYNTASFRYDIERKSCSRVSANAFSSSRDPLLSRLPHSAGTFGTIQLSPHGGDPMLVLL